ncbi:MAG: hypothetical protein U1G07_16425 [Verrucomicrobiota bacterium]
MSTLAISSILGVVQTLTLEQRAQLEACEAVLLKGWTASVEAGRALKEIRDAGLYKENFNSFEDYYAKKWGYRRARVYHLIAAAEVMENLAGLPDIIPPTHEAQLRPLVGVPAPQAQLIWQCACAKSGGQPVTAQLVKSAMRDLQLAKETTLLPRPRIDRVALRKAVDDCIGELLTLISQHVSYETLTAKVEELHGCVRRLVAERVKR